MQKLTDYQKLLYKGVTRFSDIRFTGQVVFVVIVLLITWSGVRAIQTNYNLQKQVSNLNEQNSLSNLENGNISLENQYFSSSQYQELSARENFGLAAPGEKEVLVPQSVALSYTKNISSVAQTTQGSTTESQLNYNKWLDFFLHRSSNN